MVRKLGRSVADALGREGDLDAQTRHLVRMMEDEGLIHMNDDGTVSVRGTREQLAKYGMAPEKFHEAGIAYETEFEPDDEGHVGVTFRRMSEAEKEFDIAHSNLREAAINAADHFAYRDTPPDGFIQEESPTEEQMQALIDRYAGGSVRPEDQLILTHGAAKPMLWPASVLAAAEASGEKYRRFTRDELQAWQEKGGEVGMVDFVTNFVPDKGPNTPYTVRTPCGNMQAPESLTMSVPDERSYSRQWFHFFNSTVR